MMQQMRVMGRIRQFAFQVKEERKLRRFQAAGHLPWSKGYEIYKRRTIEAVIHRSDWNPYTIPEGHGWRIDERVVEYPWFFSRLPDHAGTLLDAGSVLNAKFLLEQAKLQNKTTTIVTLAPENVAYWEKGISYVFNDLRDTCFRNEQFDWIACLSTLEHVGLDNTMLYTSDQTKNENDREAYLTVILEMRRILKAGGTLFLTVPFGAAANHGWFQIFDATMIDRILSAFMPANYIETIYQYTPTGWTTGSRASTREATYFDIHKQKDYDADFAAASRAVICLELRK